MLSWLNLQLIGHLLLHCKISSWIKSQFGKSGGDLVYEGEIVDYRISPMTATADQQASQNRLKIRVNVRFTNRNKK
jgi:hypothetical protein